MYSDKELNCKECNAPFVFTAGEQEFYAERGFVNEPQRCKACRDQRKSRARDAYRCLRNLRRRGKSPLPSARGQAGLLQRLLRERKRGAAVTSGATYRPAADRFGAAMHPDSVAERSVQARAVTLSGGSFGGMA